MNCRYCFYADETSKREVGCYGTMEESTVENIVSKFMDYSDGYVNFVFQGGEPTLAGLDFFRNFVKLVDGHRFKREHVGFSIQTNGTLLDGEWASFFKENNFLVGLSFDGPKDCHDLNRVDSNGNGTFDKVLAAAKILEKNKVDFNVVCVVNKYTARHIDDIYGFFKENNLLYQQYIPCLDPVFEEREKNPYSLSNDDFKYFLCRLFDLWYEDKCKGNFIYVHYFESLAAVILGMNPPSCGMSGVCSLQNVIEADGSIYPCDFYMLDSYRIGNINTDELGLIDEKRKGFLKESCNGLEKCTSCKWGFVCKGGCRRDRQYENTVGENYFCKAYYSFFEYSYERLRSLIRQ